MYVCLACGGRSEVYGIVCGCCFEDHTLVALAVETRAPASAAGSSQYLWRGR